MREDSDGISEGGGSGSIETVRPGHDSTGYRRTLIAHRIQNALAHYAKGNAELVAAINAADDVFDDPRIQEAVRILGLVRFVDMKIRVIPKMGEALSKLKSGRKKS